MTSYAPETPAPWAELAADIEHIVIGKDVEKLGAYAFKGLEKLVSVSFEDYSKLTVIEEYAFADCKELTEIILPDKLEKLGEAAFANCVKLAKVVLPETLLEFEIITIVPENPELIVPREPVDVFDGCDMNLLVLVVTRDSAAERYAVDHGIKLEYDEPEISEEPEPAPAEDTAIIIIPEEPEIEQPDVDPIVEELETD